MKSIWAKGESRTKNFAVCFVRSWTPEPGETLKIAATPAYRLFLNGEFKHYGPARAAHHFVRTDEFDLDAYAGRPLAAAVEIIGANVNTYCYADQPPAFGAEVCRGGKVLFDAAYLGYCSGNVANDAYGFRKFVEDGHNVALTLSFSKNFGLYGERAGIVSVVTANPKERENTIEQLKIGARALWSCPPLYGARIVTTILNDPVLKAQWEKECAAMSQRIKDMRALLVENLKKAGSTRDWSHITKQSGMFSYTGLTPEQIDRLRTEFHVYILGSSRASVAAINPSNVEYLAKAMHEVTK